MRTIWLSFAQTSAATAAEDTSLLSVRLSCRQLQGADTAAVFGLWRVCFPPCLVRPGRRLPVQGLSEGSLGCLDRLPA